MYTLATVLASLLACLVISLAGLSVEPVQIEDSRNYLPMCEGVAPEQVEVGVFELLPHFGWYPDPTDHREALYPPVCED